MGEKHTCCSILAALVIATCAQAQSTKTYYQDLGAKLERRYISGSTYLAPVITFSKAKLINALLVSGATQLTLADEAKVRAEIDKTLATLTLVPNKIQLESKGKRIKSASGTRFQTLESVIDKPNAFHIYAEDAKQIDSTYYVTQDEPKKQIILVLKDRTVIREGYQLQIEAKKLGPSNFNDTILIHASSPSVGGGKPDDGSEILHEGVRGAITSEYAEISVGTADSLRAELDTLGAIQQSEKKKYKRASIESTQVKVNASYVKEEAEISLKSTLCTSALDDRSSIVLNYGRPSRQLSGNLLTGIYSFDLATNQAVQNIRPGATYSWRYGDRRSGKFDPSKLVSTDKVQLPLYFEIGSRVAYSIKGTRLRGVPSDFDSYGLLIRPRFAIGLNKAMISGGPFPISMSGVGEAVFAPKHTGRAVIEDRFGLKATLKFTFGDTEGTNFQIGFVTGDNVDQDLAVLAPTYSLGFNFKL